MATWRPALDAGEAPPARAASAGKAIAMRLLLTILSAAMIVAAPLAQAAENAPQAAPAADYKYKTPKLDRAHVDALLAKPGNLLLIDVRRPDEITAVGGFPVYLSLQADSVEKSVAFIPKGRTIVTVSNHAHRAGAVGDALAAHGFKVAGAIGVQDYEAEGGTVTKIAPPAKSAEAAGH
jgi:rhodanese-related sulfurtransferase